MPDYCTCAEKKRLEETEKVLVSMAVDLCAAQSCIQCPIENICDRNSSDYSNIVNYYLAKAKDEREKENQ